MDLDAYGRFCIHIFNRVLLCVNICLTLFDNTALMNLHNQNVYSLGPEETYWTSDL